MKNIKLLLLFTLIVLMPNISSAQKVKITDGKIPSFSAERTVQVEFDYSDMTVGKKDEAEYVAEKVKEKNEDEAGKGDEWHKRWVADREERFEGKFIELFNKQVKDKGLKMSTSADNAKYKMHVRTTHTEPGFNVGVVKKPAHIHLEIDIIEIASGENVTTISIKKIKGTDGMGFDFDVAKRLQEGYAKGGKTLGKHFSKKVLKKKKK